MVNRDDELKLETRSNFELFYEFCLWDYQQDKVALDQIKDEIKRRQINLDLFKFSAIAFMYNLGSFELEALYSDRWDFFESKGRRTFKLTIGLFILKTCLLLYLLIKSFSIDNLIFKTLFLLGAAALFLPHAIKTINDIRNYKRAGNK